MQVYIELAVLENFCMDFTLLYCAKITSKNAAGSFKITMASALGAAFAVIFPLFKLHPALSAAVKIAAGIIMCLAAAKLNGLKSFVKFAGAFFIYSALLAGAIIGVFSLAGVKYQNGAGYILSSVPVGIPLFGALMLVLLAKHIKNKFAKSGKTQVVCKISVGQNSVTLAGFFDSGDKVYLRGQPVSVIPESYAKKLVDLSGIKESVKVHTVAGSKTIKVFSADSLEIEKDGKISSFKNTKIGVSGAKLYNAVLHPDLAED